MENSAIFCVHTRPYIGYWHLIHVRNSVCFSFMASHVFSHCFSVTAPVIELTGSVDEFEADLRKAGVRAR